MFIVLQSVPRGCELLESRDNVCFVSSSGGCSVNGAGEVGDELPGTMSWSQVWSSPGCALRDPLSPQMKESRDSERVRLMPHRGWAGGSCPWSPALLHLGVSWMGGLAEASGAGAGLEPSSAVARPQPGF